MSRHLSLRRMAPELRTPTLSRAQEDPAKAAAAKEAHKRKSVEDGEKAWLVRHHVALRTHPRRIAAAAC